VLREKLNYQAVTDNVELKERVRVSEEENQSLRSEQGAKLTLTHSQNAS